MPPPTPAISELNDTALIAAVARAYSEKAQTSVPAAYAAQVTRSLGYTEEDVQSVPSGAHFGVGCGNPVSAAALQKGEKVLDLGSGGGIDVFLAAARVGPTGQAIGLDVSGDMIVLARDNAKKQNLKPPHVTFVQASLADSLPVASDTIDCILSNCVINLLPKAGKENLLTEIYRVLKPGGRVIIDDIIAKQPFSDEIRKDLTSYINCVSGCIQLEEYQALFKDAGFTDVHFLETKNDLEKPCSGSIDCCITGTTVRPDVNSLVASYQITAHKSNGPVPDDTPTNPLLRWWDAYPAVHSKAPLVQVEELASLIRDKASDFAVIDVRWNDHGGGHVRGSDNWHAQTFYDDLPAFLGKYRHTSRVVFYCGSSSGRGPRCAGWYQDYLNQTGTTTSTAYVLLGGVKSWLAKFANDELLVDRD